MCGPPFICFLFRITVFQLCLSRFCINHIVQTSLKKLTLWMKITIEIF